MKPKVYLTNSSQKNISSNTKYKWVHLYAGSPVPPIQGGSFNHLINDILKDNEDHLLISRYYKESYEISQTSSDYDLRHATLDRFREHISLMISSIIWTINH